ncbi:MAG: DNA gyrase subunit A [Epulopiscium sp. Nuni2H_MBin001]|nr:MAG: DNA gyrase subunit A [Epulopiscium sp. Nuni2H_MBin001]
MDKIVPINIEQEMKNCYIDYAMSVIVSRALPDVRDGLKPVHRRILYAMDELNLFPDKQYRKSARIVGDTMGKYHPHGDSSIYEAMVRLAQDFSTRYPLVDGHGNFGNIDGDSAAAMRYTEARMSKLTMYMLVDADKQTVDFAPNFDESIQEPVVLPARYPNLLVNGSSGIAVGMATNIPPHNMGEIIDGVLKIIDNYIGENEESEKRETDISELLSIINGPDFPTGGIIQGKYGIEQAYRTGKGKIRVKARAEIEEMSGGKTAIIITEIPYQVNKAKLIEKIAELVKTKKIDGITGLRDESDREGMRIVIELRRDVNGNIILNQLYKYTRLQDTFSINMLALINNEPKIFTLKQMLEAYLEHQKDVVTRRTKYNLTKAEDRAHIVEGLLKALDKVDLVIKVIRSSNNVQEAKEKLQENIELSMQQAQAIVDMRFRTLTGLEREKLQDEYSELNNTINYLKSILDNEDNLFKVIKEELEEVKVKFTDNRRSEITLLDDELDIEDLIDEEEVVVTITHFGYIKRIPLDTYKEQKRGGKGVLGVNTIQDDFIEKLFTTSNLDDIMFFTTKGKAYRIKAYKIPAASRTARGVAIVNLLELNNDEKISAIFPVQTNDNRRYLTMVTKNGLIKKTNIDSFNNIRKGGLIALTLVEDDELIGVYETTDDDSIIIATKKGQGIMFEGQNVRPMGRNAKGVKAINLAKDDYVISATVPKEGEQILIATKQGIGKRTKIDEFRSQKRGGKGLKIYKVDDKTGDVVAITSVHEEQGLLMITSEGIIIRIKVNQISLLGRYARGVKLINLKDGVHVVCIEKVTDIAEQEEVLENLQEEILEKLPKEILEEFPEELSSDKISIEILSDDVSEVNDD